MFAHIFNTGGFGPVTIIGIACVFFGVFFAMRKGLGFLPGDGGTGSFRVAKRRANQSGS